MRALRVPTSIRRQAARFSFTSARSVLNDRSFLLGLLLGARVAVSRGTGGTTLSWRWRRRGPADCDVVASAPAQSGSPLGGSPRPRNDRRRRLATASATLVALVTPGADLGLALGSRERPARTCAATTAALLHFPDDALTVEVAEITEVWRPVAPCSSRCGGWQ